MKKFTLTAILLATAIGAQAQVAISGKMGQYYDSTKTGDTTVNSIKSEPTSNITFKVTEDLGGGLKANVIVDTKLAPNDPTASNTQFGDRESTIGLSHKLGSANLGRSYHSAYNVIKTTDVFSGMYGSAIADIHNDQGKRLSNGTFVTANVIPGVTASYERQNQTGTEATGYGLSAKVGNYGVKAARFESGTSKTEIVGASAQFGNLLATGLYSEDTVSSVKSKGYTLGAAYKTNSPVTLKASYGKKNQDPIFVIGPSSSSPAEVTKAYALGADYAFSKRTVAQIVYRTVNKEGTSSDVKQVGVGLVHQF